MSSELIYDSANEMFLDLLQMCHDGQEVKPRGQTCFETRCVTALLLDPTRNIITHPARKLNYHFMVAEWLWILGGLNDVKTIAGYNKKIADFSDDGITFFGAYGPRFIRDFARVYALLKRDPDSRQAVINIWNPEALRVETKDVPCTLTWQFFIRNNQLEMHACMRSNDIWLGFPYDLFNFTQIQRYLASWLGIEAGAYVHTVGSLHLYERNEIDALKVIEDPLVIESPVSPAPTFPVPVSVLGVLQGLPGGWVVPNDANEMINYLSNDAWREYASVLLHRFTKEPSHLGPFFQDLIT